MANINKGFDPDKDLQQGGGGDTGSSPNLGGGTDSSTTSATSKTLKTRIKLRYDTLANWEAQKTKTLLEGEVAVVAIPTDSSVEQVEGTTPPQILFKVGAKKPGSEALYTFEELPWASGMAADVYNWAKKDQIEITDSTQGNFLTDVKWEADKLVLTRGTVKSTITPNITSDGVITHTSQAGENGFTLDLKHAKEGPSGGYTSSNTITSIGAGDLKTIKIPQLTVNAYGHTTAAVDEEITISIPSVPSITVTPDSPADTDPGSVDSVVVLKKISAKNHTITQTGVQVPTKHYVDNKVAGSVDYLGLISNMDELSTTASKGDFYRAQNDFNTTEYSTIITSDNPGGLTPRELIYQGNFWYLEEKQRIPIDKIQINVTTLPVGITLYYQNVGKWSGSSAQTIFSTTHRDLNQIDSRFRNNIKTTTIPPIQSGDLLIAAKTYPLATIDDLKGYSIVKSSDEYKGTVTEISIGSGLSTTVANQRITTVGDIRHATIATTSTEKSSRTYINGLEFDGMGHITKYTTHTESDQAVNDGLLTINKDASITGNTISFSANQAKATTEKWSVTNWSTNLNYRNIATSGTADYRLEDNEKNTIILDGGAAGTW